MKLYEIGENEQIQIIAKNEEASWEYTTKIVMNQKNILFIEPIMHNGMVVNFQVGQVQTDVVHTGEDGKPLVWEKCLMKSVTYGGEKYHVIYSDKDGKKLNRRDTFRQYVGTSGILQIDSTRAMKSVTIKDISETGVGFVSDDMSLHMEDIGEFHLSFQDKDLRVSVKIEGTVVREVDVEETRRVFGAKIRECNVDLIEYVAMKQKREIAKRRSR